MGQEISPFLALVDTLCDRGVEWHRDTVLANSIANVPHIVNTIRAVKPSTSPCLIVSAGPSLYREGILPRIHGKFGGTIVATDGAYLQCLKAGVVPDYVVTLDPHPTRVVRWFGDPELEKNLNGDDYFSRQDLDISFRENAKEENEKNIQLVNRYKAPLIISSTCAQNVVKRTALHERYWFAPLVDDPDSATSLTRQIISETSLPALNTGGTVGTAAWVFARSILKSGNIALVGMDFGYYADTPLKQTQSWHMLGGNPEMYPSLVNPDAVTFYTDPTYYWYRENFFSLLHGNDATVTNCSGGGIFFGPLVHWTKLEAWLASCS